MNTIEVYKSGKKLLGSNFIGVFPLDKLPRQLKRGAYVINTDPAHRPGQHWIAVNISKSEINVFEPYGFYYPKYLTNRLRATGLPIKFNKTQCQNLLTTNCGPLCLLYLTLLY